MKKTKYEKPEGIIRQPDERDPTFIEKKPTKAVFTREEFYGFVAGSYAAARRKMYLEKISQRPRNPRLDDRGHEVLSPHSVVAEIDMNPLSTRQNLSRFIGSHLEGDDGYDTETDLVKDANGNIIAQNDDRDYYQPERDVNPPSPHELRARKLDQKLTRARKAHSEKSKEVKKKGETPTHKDTPIEQAIEESKKAPKEGQ